MSSGWDKQQARREIRQTVFGAFQRKGWAKSRKSAVYKVGDGISGVVAMESAKYGTYMRVGVGFWFPDDSGERLPDYKCPVLFPLVYLYRDQRERMRPALCHESTSPEALAWLAEFLEQTAVDEISALVSKDKLREILTGERLPAARVFFRAREVLGIPLP